MKTIYIKLATGEEFSFVIGEDSKALEICVRPVQYSFAAVKDAYDKSEITTYGFRQLRVKGDDFALKGEYYQATERGPEIAPCDCCEDRTIH